MAPLNMERACADCAFGLTLASAACARRRSHRRDRPLVRRLFRTRGGLGNQIDVHRDRSDPRTFGRAWSTSSARISGKTRSRSRRWKSHDPKFRGMAQEFKIEGATR